MRLVPLLYPWFCYQPGSEFEYVGAQNSYRDNRNTFFGDTFRS
jgi:hypothetical protein